MPISEDDCDIAIGIVSPNGEIIEHSTDWESAREAAANMGEFFASPKAALGKDETPVDAARDFIMQGLDDLLRDDLTKMPLTLTATAYVIINSLPEEAVESVRAVLIANHEERLSLLCFNTMEQYESACAYYMQQEEEPASDNLGTPPTPTLH